MVSMIALSIALAFPAQTQLGSSGGLTTATFNTPQGAVRIYLPDDLQAGDRISGTVVAIPAGASPGEREANASTLQGLVVTSPGGDASPNGPQFEWQFPSGVAEGAFELKLAEPSGRTRGTLTVPYAPPGIAAGDFHFPQFTTPGSPVQVFGPFDGQLKNTQAYLGSSPVPIIAESPRKAIVVCPPDELGPTTISCTEGENSGGDRIRVIGLSLEADKNTVLAGENVNVQLTVSGCQDLEEPLKVRVINLSPDVVDMQGGNDREFEVTEEMVRATGICGYQLLLMSKRAGSFLLQAKPPEQPNAPQAVDEKKCPPGFKPHEKHPDGVQGDETELGGATKVGPQGFKPDAKTDKQNKGDPNDDSKWQHWEKPEKKTFDDVIIWLQKLYVISFDKDGKLFRGGQYRVHFKYKGSDCAGGKWRQVVRSTTYVGDAENNLKRAALVDGRYVPEPDGATPPQWQIDTNDAGRAAKNPDYPHQDKGEMIDRPQRAKQAFAHYTNNTPPRTRAKVIVEEVEFYTYFIKDGKICKMFRWKMRLKWVFGAGDDPADPNSMKNAKVSSEMTDPSECTPGTPDWVAGEAAHTEAMAGFPK